MFHPWADEAQAGRYIIIIEYILPAVTGVSCCVSYLGHEA